MPPRAGGFGVDCSIMIVILDRGHGQKAVGTPFDSGVVHHGVKEIDLSAAYIKHAAEALRSAGHGVHLLDTGSYDARHAQAVAIAAEHPESAALYVQCHVNSGGGAYGTMEHDGRSARGSVAAKALAEALQGLPEVNKVKVQALRPGIRGWVCIDGIYASKTMCAVLYEPFFIDSASHEALQKPEGLLRVGVALAAGVGRYSQAIANA